MVDGIYSIKEEMPIEYRPYIDKFYTDCHDIKTVPTDISDYEKRESILDVKEIVDLVEDLFANTPFYEIYKSYAKNRINNLAFSKNNLGNCWGYSSIIENTQDGFICLYNAKSIQTVSTLAHEYGHLISGQTNFLVKSGLTKRYMYEIESIFFELVALQYCKDLGFVDANRFGYLDYSAYYRRNADISRAYELSIAVNSFEEMPLMAAKEIKFPKNIFGSIMSLSKVNSDAILYDMSFLVAVELYQIYLVDANAAYDLLVEIGKSNNPHTQFKRILNLGINPSENIKKYAMSKSCPNL